MPALPTSRLESLLAPYLGSHPTPAPLYEQLSAYLDLLLKWNARTNLTAIREPEAIVHRHFGESLFAGTHLASRLAPHAALLDFGSGAGFPGLPIQLLLPHLRVTLAESQNKKAAFLREAVRTLGLSTEVFAARVETMAAGQRFDAVTLRAVDRMPEALDAARGRIVPGGWLAVLTTGRDSAATEEFAIPGTENGYLTLTQHPETA
jgi:16S rRNA (guanine527-N7)-methyltransferase